MMNFGPRILYALLIAALIAADTSWAQAGSNDGSVPKGKPAVRATKKNTLIYDHLLLRTQTANLPPDDKAFDPPPRVLDVGDGDYFQVVFERTYPACFSYTIKVVDDDEGKVASQVPGRLSIPVSKGDLTVASVTMKHRAGISRYRVSASLLCASSVSADEVAALVVESMARSQSVADRTQAARIQSLDPRLWSKDVEVSKFAVESGLPLSGQPVDLRGVEFDLYVRTALEWELTLLGGVAWQNFGGSDYFVKKSSTETVVDGKTQVVESLSVEQTPVAKGRNAGVMTLASVYPPLRLPRWSPRVGAAFGFGGDGGDLRYYTGLSVDAGKHLTFSAGRVFGSQKALPLGQEVGKKPVSDNVLANLRDVPASAWYFGVALGFDIKSTPDFTGALKSATTTTPDVPEKPSTTALSGTFATDKGDFVVVSPYLNGVMLHVGGKDIALPVRKGLVFTDQSGVQSVTFTIPEGKDKPSEVKLTGGSPTFTAKPPLPLPAFDGTYVAGDAQYVVTAADSTLSIVLPDKTKAELRRTKNLAFTSDPPKVDIEFVAAGDKVTGLKHGAATATRQ